MEEKVRIVIADDHAILRQGLRLALEAHPGWKVIGEAQDGWEAVDLALTLEPDLVLMDLSMPRLNGLGAIQEIKSQRPTTKILVLTVHKAEEYLHAALGAGADGYVLKSITESNLIAAINATLEGRFFLDPGITLTVVAGYLESKKTIKTATFKNTLTLRELEILRMIAEGHKAKKIANRLCISPKTVWKHRRNIMKKLDLHSDDALAIYATEQGLFAR